MDKWLWDTGAISMTNNAWRVRRGSRTHPCYQPHREPSRNGNLQKLLGHEVKSAGCATSLFHGKDLQATSEEVVE